MFADIELPKTKLSMVGRYDYFAQRTGIFYLNRINTIMADYSLKNKLVLGAEY